MKKTVLLIDDDVDFLTQQKILLENANFDVVTAESQKEGEEKFAQRRPDVVICDLMMENADGGFALCYHIKKKDASVPVILVTAVAGETGLEFDAATAEERQWIKADVMLNKPVRFEQLMREIERLTA
ncbi:MAG: response regulator [Sedimentisphaerales bacterium]|nr:response regulator [Sedimentisphaerales bacterium]